MSKHQFCTFIFDITYLHFSTFAVYIVNLYSSNAQHISWLKTRSDCEGTSSCSYDSP